MCLQLLIRQPLVLLFQAGIHRLRSDRRKTEKGEPHRRTGRQWGLTIRRAREVLGGAARVRGGKGACPADGAQVQVGQHVLTLDACGVGTSVTLFLYEQTMAKNERTSPAVASIASKVLKTGVATPTQAKILAASALTQTKDKKKS